MASSFSAAKKFAQFDVVKDCSDHKHVASRNKVASGCPLYKAIMKEWKILQEHLPKSIYVRVYETRMELMRAVIVGPTGTPYHDGLFFFDILFPSDYPNRPPTVTYWSFGYRLNPNLYKNGFVCLSLLNTWNGTGNERWVPQKSTLLQVLVSLEGLVLNEMPYFNEPGMNASNKKAAKSYNDRAFVFSLKTMQLLIEKPPRNFEDFIGAHFRDRSRAILISCQAYMNGFLVVGQYRDGQRLMEKPVEVEKSLRKSIEQPYNRLVQSFKKNDPFLEGFLGRFWSDQMVETEKREYKSRILTRKVEIEKGDYKPMILTRKVEIEKGDYKPRKKAKKGEQKKRSMGENLVFAIALSVVVGIASSLLIRR